MRRLIKDFFPNQKQTKQFIGSLSANFYEEIVTLDRPQLEAMIKICRGFTSTNCGWIEFQLAPGIIRLLEARLHDITPTSQLKQ